MNKNSTVKKIRECCFAFLKGIRVYAIIAAILGLIVSAFSLFGIANGYTLAIYISGLVVLFLGVINGFIKFLEVLNTDDKEKFGIKFKVKNKQLESIRK